LSISEEGEQKDVLAGRFAHAFCNFNPIVNAQESSELGLSPLAIADYDARPI
jgi:hypothetical protein